MHGSQEQTGQIAEGISALEFGEVEEPRADKEGTIECPVVALLDTVLYPHMVVPLFVSTKRALMALDAALDEDNTLIGVTTRNPAPIASRRSDPGPGDLYDIATEVAVGRTLRMPDDSTSVLVRGRHRVEIVEFTQVEP